MSDITIWHNPRCTKSRQALDFLRDKGHMPDIIAYLADPPSEQALRDAASAMGLSAIQMMRPKEALFAELGLSKTDPEDVLFAAMAANPRLIERPIIFTPKGVRIARPTEAILDIL